MDELLRKEVDGDIRLARKSTERRGAGGYTLCERCNNETGALYVPAYVWWAHQGMSYFNAGGSSLALPFRLFPGRVAKQIMCMFASACGIGFTDKNPEVRKFVLDKDAIGLPQNLRLYMFLMGRKSMSTRQAGVTGQLIGFGQGRVHTFAEISFPPYGYILSFNSPPPDNDLTDITFFTHHQWKDYRELHLRLPIREVNSYFPGDFRTSEQWLKVLEENPRKKAGAARGS